jgi:hypothetical protein
VISRRAIIVYALLVAATPVNAQPAGSQAQVLYDNGRNLMAAGKTAEACAAFQQSQKLDPLATTLIALATCRERLGLLASALELFREAERQTQSTSDKMTAQLHQIARERATKLEERVSKLTIHVPATSKIEGLQILRDQDNIPEASWNRTVPIDGGTYTITARAPGANQWSTPVTLASEADAKTIDVPDLRTIKSSFEEPPQAPAPNQPVTEPRTTAPAPSSSGAAQSATPPETPDSPRPRQSFAPLAVGASAVVLLGGALGVRLWGDSTYDAAKVEMTNQPRRDSLYDSANRKLYAAQGLVVAGVGCAGVAVWLYLRQRSTHAETTATHARRLMLAPTTAGVGVIGQF